MKLANIGMERSQMHQYNLPLVIDYRCWNRSGADTLLLGRRIVVGGARENSLVEWVWRRHAGTSGRALRVDSVGLVEHTLTKLEGQARSLLVLRLRLLVVGVAARHWGLSFGLLGWHDED
jgi:hypothetical protein